MGAGGKGANFEFLPFFFFVGGEVGHWALGRSEARSGQQKGKGYARSPARQQTVKNEQK